LKKQALNNSCVSKDAQVAGVRRLCAD
jgi:hypothetical protein